jgi:hypothetical protein
VQLGFQNVTSKDAGPKTGIYSRSILEA